MIYINCVSDLFHLTLGLKVPPLSHKSSSLSFTAGQSSLCVNTAMSFSTTQRLRSDLRPPCLLAAGGRSGGPGSSACVSVFSPPCWCSPPHLQVQRPTPKIRYLSFRKSKAIPALIYRGDLCAGPERPGRGCSAGVPPGKRPCLACPLEDSRSPASPPARRSASPSPGLHRPPRPALPAAQLSAC